MALGLQGCAVTETQEQVRQGAVQQKKDIEDGFAKLEASKRSGAVTRVRASKVGGEEIQLDAVKTLPPIFDRVFSYASATQPLAAVVDEISRRAGVPIRLINVALNDVAGPAEGTDPALRGRPVEVEFNGKLRHLLDQIAQRAGVYWRYAEGQVEFFEVETRSFQVFMSPGRKTVSSSISLSGAGGAAGTAGGGSGGEAVSSGSPSAGTVSVDSTVDIDVYDSLVSSIRALIQERVGSGGVQSAGGAASNGSRIGGAGAGGTGGLQASVGSKSQVVANPALSMVTVTAPPPVMERVAAYMKSVNDRFASNVRIEVKIYSMTLKKGANLGFSAEMLYTRLNRYGLAVSGQGLLQPALGQASTLTLSATDPSSRFRGSELLVQALAEQGEIGFVTSGQVLAVNGQPAPLQVANEITYLASTSTTQTANVGVTTTLTPATRTVGFTANFVPTILSDSRILLQYQINLSQLAGITQVSSGGSSIQTPNILQQSLQQQAFVRDGQMIVLFGFETDRNETSSNLGFTGASKNAVGERQMTIITLSVHGGRNV